jgi:hypothetical protein
MEPTMWLSLVIAVVLSAGAIYFAVAPLLKPGKATLLVEDDKFTQLLGRKDATLQAIKELEFDYRVGKMSDEDFQRMDQRLRRQAIVLIQQVEKLAPAEAALDDQIETMIARMRQMQNVAPPVPTAAPVAAKPALGNGHTAHPTPPASPTPASPTAAARFCTNCGERLEAGHKFCAHCGTPVSAPHAVAEESA